MKEPKIGNKKGVEEAGKRFEKLFKQPVSQRISNFLKEEGKKEKASENKKKIAQSNIVNNLDV